MFQINRSPDKHAFLVDNNNSRSGKLLKYSGSLLLAAALCALGIWSFTPVSEEADYKPGLAQNAIDIAIPAPEQAPDSTVTAHRPGLHSTAPEIEPQRDTAVTAYHIEPALENPADQPLTTEELKLQRLAFDSFSEPSVNDLEPLVYEDTQIETGAGIEPAEYGMASAQLQPRLEHDGRIETITIKSGDTLTRLFSRAGLPVSQAIKLAQEEAADKLNRLSIGKTMRIYFDENEQWESLEYDTDKLNTLIVAHHQGEFQINQHEKQVDYRTFTANGTIQSSLGVAAESAGVSPGITQALVDIYKWEIDFARDIRAGDTFSVVYQKAYIGDEVVDDGPILAASFTSGGRTIDAIRYTDSEGTTAYFQPDGESLRRGFLRTPVKLARVTSGFGKRRHPIKKTWRKHLGVDYGAPRGTPILATADGVVQYAGKKGGYGNTVILRHGGIYTTLYAHMSKLGKGIRSGKSVTQGQVIGHVGRTGWATGDHLHYEFRINGQHKNPLKVDLPKVNPLAKKEMPTFTDQAQPLLGTLTALRAAQLANLESSETEPTL